eukprot:scaffold1199_cov265-Pinguiococcus_pyrenoidosus.AAC.6
MGAPEGPGHDAVLVCVHPRIQGRPVEEGHVIKRQEVHRAVPLQQHRAKLVVDDDPLVAPPVDVEGGAGIVLARRLSGHQRNARLHPDLSFRDQHEKRNPLCGLGLLQCGDYAARLRFVISEPRFGNQMMVQPDACLPMQLIRNEGERV